MSRQPSDIECVLIDNDCCPYCTSKDNDVDEIAAAYMTYQCIECEKGWKRHHNGVVELEG